MGRTHTNIRPADQTELDGGDSWDIWTYVIFKNSECNKWKSNDFLDYFYMDNQANSEGSG